MSHPRILTRAALVLLALLVASAVVVQERSTFLDLLTGAHRSEYRIGPLRWRSGERPGVGSGWAASKLSLPETRRWTLTCTESNWLFGGLIACAMPFDAVGFLARSDLPATTRDELLRDWQAAILATSTDADSKEASRAWRDEHAEFLDLEP